MVVLLLASIANGQAQIELNTTLMESTFMIESSEWTRDAQRWNSFYNG